MRNNAEGKHRRSPYDQRRKRIMKLPSLVISPQEQAGFSSGNPAAAGFQLEPCSAATEDMFRSLLESAPDAIVIVDTTGRITIVNTEAEHLFGYARIELIGRPIEI